jgi:repressor LexA
MKTLSEPATRRQQEVLDYIRLFLATYGYPPSIREIAAELSIASPNGVMCHLEALEQKGFISREPGESRAITITVAKGHCHCCGQPISKKGK